MSQIVDLQFEGPNRGEVGLLLDGVVDAIDSVLDLDFDFAVGFSFDDGFSLDVGRIHNQYFDFET
ncbi:MAG: hypothetical protein AAGJ80_06825 [Cyanobacteria bacterium J06553_1]